MVGGGGDAERESRGDVGVAKGLRRGDVGAS